MPENLFAACRIDGELIAKRVRLDNTVQQAVEAVFNNQEAEFRRGVTSEVDFDGSWKPDEDEVLSIDVPQEGALFADTIDANPLSIREIDTAHFDTEGIKALFTGVRVNRATKVLVQGFHHNKYSRADFRCSRTAMPSGVCPTRLSLWTTR
jgi:hypothetical protein